jgi:flagellar hook-length control protein FliK
MNLFNLIGNGTAPKTPLTEANAGHATPRLDPPGLNQQEFSKYLQKLLAAKVQTQASDSQRQDLADSQRAEAATPASNPVSDRPDRVSRDSRFDAPKNNVRADRAPAPRAAPTHEHASPSKDSSTSAHNAHPSVNRRAELPSKSDNSDSKEAAQTAAEANAPDAKVSTTESAPSVTSANASSQLPDSAQPNNAGLVALQLSPHVQVITADSPATSDESLVSYARSMGMADSTIQQLLGKNPMASDLHASNFPVTTGTDPSQAASAFATVSAWPAGSLLQSLMGRGIAQLPSNPLAEGVMSTKASPSDALTHVQAAMLEGIDQVSIQIGTANASNVQTFTAMPASTLAVLSMLDTQLTPEAIDSLQKEFNAVATESGNDPQSDVLSVGSFGAKMAAGGAHMPTAGAVSSAQQMAHMAETYEKLSDKLATELAARLHQQISDGQWKMKFALKPASLGAVDIQLEMRDGKLAALFQADNPLTQDLLQNSSQRLKDALHNLGMSQTSVQVGQGHAQSQSNGQNQTSPDATKFGDNRGQTQDADPNALADIGQRRSSDSQFDIYA